MPKPRAARLETASARRKLAVAKKPYYAKIAPGIHLGYRRNEGAGTWSVRAADGAGGEWLKRIALADDLEPAAPPHRPSTRRASSRVGSPAHPKTRAAR